MRCRQIEEQQFEKSETLSAVSKKTKRAKGIKDDRRSWFTPTYIP